MAAAGPPHLWPGLGLQAAGGSCAVRRPTPSVPFPLQLENLRASYEELQARSQEEIRRLGAQLESARSSRQELSGEELRAEDSGPL